MLNRIKALFWLSLMNITSIVIHVILLCFFPFYFLGAIFWKDEDFYKVMHKVYNALTNLFD